IDPNTGQATSINTLGQSTFGSVEIGSVLVTGTATVNGQLQDQLVVGMHGGGGAIYASTNGGATWTVKRAGAAGEMVTDLVQVPAAANAVQRVTLSGAGAGSTYKLTFEGQTTNDLDIGTSTGDQLQTALEALSSIGAGNVVVTPHTVSPTYTITFR